MDMLEATMKTILHRQGYGETESLRSSELTFWCLKELDLTRSSPPISAGEKHVRRIGSSTQEIFNQPASFSTKWEPAMSGWQATSR